MRTYDVTLLICSDSEDVGVRRASLRPVCRNVAMGGGSLKRES